MSGQMNWSHVQDQDTLELRVQFNPILKICQKPFDQLKTSVMNSFRNTEASFYFYTSETEEEAQILLNRTDRKSWIC